MALEIALGVTLGLAGGVLLVYMFLVRNYSYWQKRGVNGPKPIPLFGNVKSTTLRRVPFHQCYRKFYADHPHDKVVGLYRAWHPCLLVRDLDVLKHVMIRQFDNFVDRGFSFSNKGLGFNLFNAESDDWRVLRTRLSPMFTTGKLKNMLHLMLERGDRFLQYVEPLVERSPEQDIHTLVQRFTIGNIGACAFGIDIDINDVNGVFDKLDSLIFSSSYVIELETLLPGIMKKFDMSLWPAVIKDFFYGLVKDIVRERRGAASSRGDFMDLMLELRSAGEIHGLKRHEGDKERSLLITDDVMAAQAFVFYAAGYETSATTMAFLLHELALNPRVQERVAQEIRDVLHRHDHRVTMDCLRDMVYLERVFDETLRMYPVVDPIPRQALGRCELPGTGVTVEPGMGVLVSVSGITTTPCTGRTPPSSTLTDSCRRTPKGVTPARTCPSGWVLGTASETLSSQLPVFENFLDKAPKSGGYDAVRQSVVLLVGSLARHLEPGDARIKPITLRLIAALSTPSQQVQESVSNCLPHLVCSPALEGEIPAIMNKLMKQLLTAEKYGDRKGAAYGIAGIIKGLGILSLKQLDVMGKLTEAIQEKKNYKYREGALFGFEMLCHKLGRLFEPYIVHVLPHLLLCFGDSSQYVRAAADDTAKLIMSKLSAHGVKLVLPSLLQALNDDNWRTKAGSIELLGAMAYCAPKQLSSCLPSIVPRLIEVLSDSHMRVQAAGAEALKVIGSVIRNPEIQAIVPVLLQALQDPSNKTSACLQTLLDTKFVHFIDAPSLALIMPVVQRAFLDRSTETRKMAAQIIGNMYSLTDQKDLMPYLPSIIPGLKSSLLDPVPEVRSVSARALGAMVKGMGESSFEELLPWLMHTLTSESSSVDRSGAAQGLSEVVAGLGVQKLHKIMPDIIATAERTDIAPHVKDGYIMMFIYMPGAFTDEFLPYIGQIINPILKALADENEYVRETALKAGQRIVNLYAESAITLLLPELEKGLFDDNWRIRYSSVQLLGDLLYRISGVSGKMSTETASEDDNFGTEHSHKAIMSALGNERRNRVLAGLYMGRSDVALMVRQAALHVWKVVVTNTPKTLREILPTLFGLLLGCLASTSYDKRQVAARTLGDLVRKLGERVLPEIVPILERGLKSERADQRQGVCIGLGEILASTSRDAVLSFADGLVPTVRTALRDPLPEVRLAAARTFDSLHATIGSKALDDILPQMLEGLNDPDPAIAEATLDGLKQVMAIKSRAVLPYLVPVLTSGAADTRALSALAAAAGGALARHLPRVLPALLAALRAARHTPHEARELDHCRNALLPVADPQGVRCIIDMLLETTRCDEEDKRRAAAALLCAFVTHTRAELGPHVPQLLRGLVLLLGERERDVLQMAWDALAALTKTLDAERQVQHVADVRQAVRYAASDLKPGELLPGFCLPKGIAPILPLFRESILNGLPEDKEAAALMLGEVINLTSAEAIQPSVVHITGPLIRILGDRFNASVKAAVLETLADLLSKVGVMLKQFLPQLQTTFLKALHDGSRPVRIKAGLALAQLVRIHTRADPLFVEMHNGIRNADDPGVRETMLQALRCIITAGGGNMSAPLALAVLATLTAPALLAHADDPPRGPAGGCLGALLHCLPAPHRDAALLHHVLAPADDWLLAHGRSCALFVALKETPAVVYAPPFEERVERALLGALAGERVPVACNALRGMAYLMLYLLAAERAPPPQILSQFVRSMNHPSNEVKQLMARAATLLGRGGVLRGAHAHDTLRALLPALVNGTKEKNTYVRANAEIALRAVLQLPHDDDFHKECMALLEEGGREALGDVVARLLRRGAPDARDEQLDCTLIT